MKVKIKKLHHAAVIPKYAKGGDACVDLYAVEKHSDDFGNTVFSTGLAFEIPDGYVGLVFPRSSICKTFHQLRNSVGVIDSGYRGEVKLVFWADYSASTRYRVNDRVGQMMILPYPNIEFEEVNELTDTDRGSGSFGSTGA